MRQALLALIIYLLSFCLYIYPIAGLLHLYAGTAILTPVLGLITALIATIIYVYLSSHLTAFWLRALTYYGMGTGFIGFCLTSLGLLLAKLAPHSTQEIALITFAGIVTASAYASYQGRALSVKQLQLHSPKISKPTTFIFISDIHLGSNPASHLSAICDQIAPLTYDALLIGGDLFDSSDFNPADLAPLRAIDKPIYFVTGNHEFYVKDHQSKLDQLAAYHIRNCDNQALDVHDIRLIAIGDKQSPKTQADFAKAHLSPSAFNLILVHQPGLWPFVPAGTDFMISGHTHNGQIFPFNWLVRLQFKTVYGLYHHNQARLYVASGSGTWGPRMRLGTQNEIIQLTLLPEA